MKNRVAIVEIGRCYECPYNLGDEYCNKLCRYISAMFDLKGENFPEWCPLKEVI